MAEYLRNALIFLIPFSLCFSLRANVFVIMAYTILVVFRGDFLTRFYRAIQQKWIYPIMGLFLVHVISLLWSENLTHGMFLLEKKAALLVLPLVLAMDTEAGKSSWFAMAGLVAGSTLALWYCFYTASYFYGVYEDPIVFFYHSFGFALDKFNALYFSMFALCSLFFVAFNATGFPWIRWFLIITLTSGILLLSSKLYIVLTIGFLVIITWFHFGKNGRLHPGWALGVTLLILGLSTIKFTQKRFVELKEPVFEVLQKDHFEWNTPFNGLSLRLLLAKFGMELAGQPGTLLGGLGVGDAQDALNQKMIEKRLYTGNPAFGDKGYLDYNVHNQYLEFLLQTGIVGLGFWLWILIQGWQKALDLGMYHSFLYLMATITFFSLIESVMERQRGLVFFIFFLSIFQQTLKHGSPEVPK